VRKDIKSLVVSAESVLYNEERQHIYLHRLSEVRLHMPMKVEGFSDFMCSLEHVTNVSQLMLRQTYARKRNATNIPNQVGSLRGASQAPPNFFNMPLGYNGRASSVVVDGTSIRRPSGIILSDNGRVEYEPCKKLDFEMEMGFFVSQKLAFGQTLPASRAHEHIFGFVLLNDWSARDIQFHESTPLGPFNGKAFATSISPWVVTLDALEEAGAIIPVETTRLNSGKETSISHLRSAFDVTVQTMTYLTSKLNRSLQ
jgi:fumarylacetoacetase